MSSINDRISQHLASRNNAINLNPTTSDIGLTTPGSDWLWAVFAIMAASAFGLLIWGGRQPVGQRAFHHLAAAICFTASIAYFVMASNLGAAPIAVEFIRGGSLGQNYINNGVASNQVTRAIWYARYIDWTVTTPLLLLELLLATGLPLAEIFMVIFFDIVMIETGLIGALIASRYKWGLYAFGCAALFYIWWVLLVPGRRSARALGPEYGRTYTGSMIYLAFLWALYPIVWGLADGGNVISTNAEMIWYGILDLLAKPGYTFFHLWSLRKCDYRRFGFTTGKYSATTVPEERFWFNHGEKTGPNQNEPLAATNNNGIHPRASDATHVNAPAGNGMNGIQTAGPTPATKHTLQPASAVDRTV